MVHRYDKQSDIKRHKSDRYVHRSDKMIPLPPIGSRYTIDSSSSCDSPVRFYTLPTPYRTPSSHYRSPTTPTKTFGGPFIPPPSAFDTPSTTRSSSRSSTPIKTSVSPYRTPGTPVSPYRTPGTPVSPYRTPGTPPTPRKLSFSSCLTPCIPYEPRTSITPSKSIATLATLSAPREKSYVSPSKSITSFSDTCSRYDTLKYYGSTPSTPSKSSVLSLSTPCTPCKSLSRPCTPSRRVNTPCESDFPVNVNLMYRIAFTIWHVALHIENGYRRLETVDDDHWEDEERWAKYHYNRTRKVLLKKLN